jgi:predicted NBD/HSP70 family sugar kinase
MRRLLTIASLSSLAAAMDAAGEDSSHLWENPAPWHVSPTILDDWMTEAAEGLAAAIISASALLELGAVLIDGWMPAEIRAEITRRTHASLHRMDLQGIDPPQIREGTIGPEARALGAAAIPLAQRYLLEQGAVLTEG